MKSKSILIIFFLFLTLIVFCDESVGNYKISEELGFDVFLKQSIGKEISVTIANLDITISGRLITIYKDSIVIRSFSKDVLISKDHIAFVKIKIEEEESEE